MRTIVHFRGNIYRALHTILTLYLTEDNILIALYLHLFAHMPLAVDKKTYFIGGITNWSIPDYSINKKGNVFFKLCSHRYSYILPLVEFAIKAPLHLRLDLLLLLHFNFPHYNNWTCSYSSPFAWWSRSFSIHIFTFPCRVQLVFEIYCCVFLHRSLLCWWL